MNKKRVTPKSTNPLVVRSGPLAGAIVLNGKGLTVGNTMYVDIATDDDYCNACARDGAKTLGDFYKSELHSGRWLWVWACEHHFRTEGLHISPGDYEI